MAWNHRSGSQWRTITPKVRRGGEWVTIGGAGGGGGGGATGEYLLTGDPPTRSTTVNESEYSSLQSALDSIGSNTRLVLDGGTYTGNWDLPTTDHITIDGNGSTLVRGSNSSQMITGSAASGRLSTSTSVSGSYSQGDEWISVSNASIFSVGDICLLKDDDEDHPDRFSSSSGTGNEGTGFFHEVVEVDTSNDQIRIAEGCILDRTNNSLEAINFEFAAEDQRITDCTFDGDDSGLTADTDVLRVFGRKGMWYDNITGYDGTGMVWQEYCYQTRVDNCDFDNTATTSPDKLKTINFSSGDHHELLTNITTQNYFHESITVGGGGGDWWGHRNAELHNCHGTDGSDTAFDIHPGGQDMRLVNCSSTRSRFLRPRASNVYVEDCEIVDPGTISIYAHNNPENLVINGLHAHGAQGTGRFMYWTTKSGRGADFEHQEWNDVWIEDGNNDLNYIWYIRNQDSSTVDVGITADHLAVDGTWVTDSTITDWINHAEGDVNFTTNATSPSDGTTPSEYFADEYGW